VRGARCNRSGANAGERSAAPEPKTATVELFQQPSGVRWSSVEHAIYCISGLSLFGAPRRSMLLYSAVRELFGTPELPPCRGRARARNAPYPRGPRPFGTRGPAPMPSPRPQKLKTPPARRKLPVRKKPYYVAISPGVFLGYCRNAGHCKWSVRVVRGRAEWTDRFATTDDLEPANGRDVLNYWQAVDQARPLARGTDDAPDNKPLTGVDALDAYERDLKPRGADPANAQRVRKHLTASLADKPVMLLSTQDLRHWRDALVAKGVEPATINRTRAGLRAALELAAT